MLIVVVGKLLISRVTCGLQIYFFTSAEPNRIQSSFIERSLILISWNSTFYLQPSTLIWHIFRNLQVHWTFWTWKKGKFPWNVIVFNQKEFYWVRLPLPLNLEFFAVFSFLHNLDNSCRIKIYQLQFCCKDTITSSEIKVSCVEWIPRILTYSLLNNIRSDFKTCCKK